MSAWQDWHDTRLSAGPTEVGTFTVFNSKQDGHCTRVGVGPTALDAGVTVIVVASP